MTRNFSAELREKIMRKDDTGEYVYDPTAAEILNFLRVMESPPKPRSKPKPKPKPKPKRDYIIKLERQKLEKQKRNRSRGTGTKTTKSPASKVKTTPRTLAARKK